MKQRCGPEAVALGEVVKATEGSGGRGRRGGGKIDEDPPVGRGRQPVPCKEWTVGEGGGGVSRRKAEERGNQQTYSGAYTERGGGAPHCCVRLHSFSRWVIRRFLLIG